MRTRVLASIFGAALLVAGMAALALVLKVVPGFRQNNIAMILLMLPPHAAIAYTLWRRRVP